MQMTIHENSSGLLHDTWCSDMILYLEVTKEGIKAQYSPFLRVIRP